MTRPRRLGLWVAVGLLLTLVAGYGVLVMVLRHPLPDGEEGPAADALARALGRTLGAKEWAGTGAVRWTFRTRHQHLWDRRRNLARVRWREADVLLDLNTKQGRAWRNRVELTGAAGAEAVERAHSFWANDSFWLAAPFKVFDAGTRRFKVTLADGRTALLVRFESGALAPGDSYLWILGPDGRPVAWRMWTARLPVGGLEVAIKKWETLATGAQVATDQELVVLGIPLTELGAAAELAGLEPGADPFSPILAAPAQ